MYIYKRKKWPNFIWDRKRVDALLLHLRHQQGRLIGGMESVGFHLSDESALQSLTLEVVKSSEIEGEVLDQASVRSSIARHLGIEDAALNRVDKSVEGIVRMMLDATQNFKRPLSKKRLLEWHKLLFSEQRNEINKIKVGAWRTGPVEVVSGQWGKEMIHFEGPQAEAVDHEMKLFINWFNTEKKLDPLLKGAIAHLWFVTIHPFEDGNGRIARAISDLMLSRSENSSRRFYSLSAQIQMERKSYYDVLECTQKGDLEITAWLDWALQCLGRAIEGAQLTFQKILQKAHFWESIAHLPLNERQKKIMNRLLDGFEGKLTTSKWAKMAKCSQDSAYRDILALIELGILVKNPEGGRNTSYSLAKGE